MSLSPRGIAVQGLGVGLLAVALQGLVPVAPSVDTLQGASPNASATHRRQTETRRILDTNNLVLALALAIYQSGCLDDFPET